MERRQRVAGEIQRVLLEVLYAEVKDPRIPELISVTEVKLNRDMSLATAYVSSLGHISIELDFRHRNKLGNPGILDFGIENF